MKPWIFFLLMGGLLQIYSCAHKNAGMKEIPAGRLIKKDDISQKIDEATALYDAGEIEAAVANLRLTVDNNAYQPAHDQCYELIVQWLLELKQQEEAKHVASYFLSHYPHSEYAQKIIDLFDKVAATSDAPLDQVNLPEEDESTDESLSDQILDFTNPTSLTEED
jgi:hypothetical protein